MKTFPTEPALEAAIVADADEDTPRLAYADWLDEHGDPDRAAFIRAQCRLADLSPAEPDWIDLREQQFELAARLKSRALGAAVPGIADIDFEPDLVDDNRNEESFHRGFPYFVGCIHGGDDWTADETARVATEMGRLVRTTTVRGFDSVLVPLARLRELFDSPAFAQLTGASLGFSRADDEATASEDFYRLVATHPTMRRVRHLFLYDGATADALAELTKATALGAVRRLWVQSIDAPRAAVERLTKAAWFRSVLHLRCRAVADPTAAALVAGLGKLPHLHTLELPSLAGAAVAPLAAGKFPALARLVYGGPGDSPHIKKLAAADFPALAAFEASGRGLKSTAFARLLKANWFARLRLLDLSANALGDTSVEALAAHPVARALRVLRLSNNPLGAGARAALTRDGAFPELTTLDLSLDTDQKATPAELAAFVAALATPRLRHFNLSGWPLTDAGAKALAANPALAGLTRLSLRGCSIGDPGAKALFASRHLRDLVELDLSHNAIRSGAAALAKPDTLPRLGECSLVGNRVPLKAAAKLERDGLALVT